MYLLGIFCLCQYTGNISGCQYLLHCSSACSFFIHVLNTKLHSCILLFLFLLRCLQIFLCLRDFLTCFDQIILKIRDLGHK